MTAVDKFGPGDAVILTRVGNVGECLVDVAFYLEVHAACVRGVRAHGLEGSAVDHAAMQLLPHALSAALFGSAEPTRH